MAVTWRSLVTWAPPFALLVASVMALGSSPTAGWPSWTLFGLAVALMPDVRRLGADLALVRAARPAVGAPGRPPLIHLDTDQGRLSASRPGCPAASGSANLRHGPIPERPMTDKPSTTLVFGPAYLDRVIRVNRPLVNPSLGERPLDGSVNGARLEAGEGLRLLDPSGNRIVVELPVDWPGPWGTIGLSRPLSPRLRAGRGPSGALSWQDDLGGMGSASPRPSGAS